MFGIASREFRLSALLVGDAPFVAAEAISTFATLFAGDLFAAGTFDPVAISRFQLDKENIRTIVGSDRLYRSFKFPLALRASILFNHSFLLFLGICLLRPADDVVLCTNQ